MLFIYNLYYQLFAVALYFGRNYNKVKNILNITLHYYLLTYLFDYLNKLIMFTKYSDINIFIKVQAKKVDSKLNLFLNQQNFRLLKNIIIAGNIFFRIIILE